MDDAEAQRRVGEARVARLATVTASGSPHVVPCCYAVFGASIVTAVDGKPKSTLALRRLANIAANPMVSFVVDHYCDEWGELWWVRVDGSASVIDDPDRREQALDVLAAKYAQYVDQRPQGAVIEIVPTTWRFWSGS